VPRSQALRDARKAGHAYLVIDGTLIPIDRVACPDGDMVWVSGPLPGAVHDLTAARIWSIIRELAACGLIVLGDKGYLGQDHNPHAVPGTEQARLTKGRQPGSCPAPGPRRARQCPAQVLAHRAQAPLLSLVRRAAGQGHPRPSDSRNRRMKTLTG